MLQPRCLLCGLVTSAVLQVTFQVEDIITLLPLNNLKMFHLKLPSATSCCLKLASSPQGVDLKWGILGYGLTIFARTGQIYAQEMHPLQIGFIFFQVNIF